MAVLVYGAVNPDLVHRVDRLPGPGDDIRSTSWRITWGGKAANAAVALATWGVDTRLTGLVVGFDALGDALIEALERPCATSSRTSRSRAFRGRPSRPAARADPEDPPDTADDPPEAALTLEQIEARIAELTARAP